MISLKNTSHAFFFQRHTIPSARPILFHVTVTIPLVAATSGGIGIGGEEKVKIPGGGPESGYLAGSVGKALQVALAEVAEKRPPDPIEYLATCLYKHSSNIQRAQEVSEGNTFQSKYSGGFSTVDRIKVKNDCRSTLNKHK